MSFAQRFIVIKENLSKAVDERLKPACDLKPCCGHGMGSCASKALVEEHEERMHFPGIQISKNVFSSSLLATDSVCIHVQCTVNDQSFRSGLFLETLWTL